MPLKTKDIQMEIFGLSGSGIVDLMKGTAPVILVGLAIYAWFRAKLDRYFNREYDTYLVSVTSAKSRGDGSYELVLDNLGSAEKFVDAVRGADVRAIMLKAARRCTWEPQGRFLLVSDREADEIHRVVLNALTKHFDDGVKAVMAADPYKTATHYFAITGSDADATSNAKRKFRVVMLNESTVQELLTNPIEAWRFSSPSHSVRLDTCRVMARAIAYNGGKLEVNGKRHKIAFPIRVYTPT